MAILFRILFTLGLLILHVSDLSAQTQVNRNGPGTPLKFVSENPTRVLASTVKNTPTYLNCHVSLKVDKQLQKDLLTIQFYHGISDDGDNDDDEDSRHDKEEINRMYQQQYARNIKKNKTVSTLATIPTAIAKKRIKRSSHEPIVYEWFRDGEKIDTQDEGFIQFPNGTLKFPTSEPKGGEYRCRAMYNDSSEKFTIGPIISQATVVEIAHLTNDLNEKKNLTAFESEAIVIICAISSTPAANFSWYFNNDELNFDGGSKQRHFLLSNGSLLIVNSEIADSGKYRCNATNQFAKKSVRSSSTMLNVLSRSDNNYNHESGLLLKLQNSTRKIRSGQILVLHCASHSTTERILWTFTPRNSIIPISLTNVNNELRYVNVSVAKHDGVYNCSTDDDFQEFDVTIVTPPKFLEQRTSMVSSVAGSIKFNCSVSGNPRPVIEWYKNGVKMSNNPIKYFDYPLLRIATIDPDDEGLYQCLARNDYGEVTNNFYFHVRPTIMLDRIPRNAKCIPLDNNKIHVTFDQEGLDNKIQYYFVMDTPRDFEPLFAQEFISKSFIVDISKSKIVKPLKPFYLYMRNMMQQSHGMAMSPLSKPIECASQGIQPKFVKAPNGIFLRWDTPETDTNVTGYTIQFLNNKTSSPVLFQNEVVGTYEKLPTFAYWDDVSQFNVKIPAKNHVKANWTEVQVSGNVTGLLLPNADEITVRILGTVMENGELFEQSIDSLSWTNIKASSVRLEPLNVVEVDSREAKISWKGLDDIAIACMCTNLKSEIFTRDSEQRLKCEKISEPSAKYFYLKNLRPTSNYDAFITNCDKTELSTRENFQTIRDVPGPVTQAQILTNNGIVLRWKPPHNPNGEIYHYLLEWTLKNVTYKQNVTALTFKFPNTTNTDRFNITVKAFGVAGLGYPLIINPDKWSILPVNYINPAEFQDSIIYFDSFMIFAIIFISLVVLLLIVAYAVCRRHRYCKNSNGIINSEQSSFPPTTSPLTENIRDEIYEMQTLIPSTQLVVANGKDINISMRTEAPSNGGVNITENQKILRTSTPTDESMEMCMELPPNDESLSIQIEGSKLANNFPTTEQIDSKNGHLKVIGNLSPYKCFQSPGNDQNSSGSSSFDSHRQLIDSNFCNGLNNNNLSDRSKIGKSSSIETDNEEEDSEENMHEYDLNDSNLSSKPLHWNFRRPLVGPNG